MSDTHPPTTNGTRPRRWDPVIKLTHWSIVIAIIVNALITEEGSTGHVWVGYALAAMLALRLLWGVIGPREARFTSFPPSPRRALLHLGDIAKGRASTHTSHNPLGALMVYAIWTTLGVIIASGIAMAGIPDAPDTRVPASPSSLATALHETDEASGEDADDSKRNEGEGEREDGPLGEVHEAAVNLLYVLILLHIAGVLFETRRSGRHIAMAMLPGGR